MRKKDELGHAPSAPGTGALAALLLLVGCLNPRPEELPSSVDSSEPSTELGDPNGSEGGEGARSGGTADINAAGAEEADDPRPAFAPPAPEPAGAPPEPADAGTDAAAESDPDAG